MFNHAFLAHDGGHQVKGRVANAAQGVFDEIIMDKPRNGYFGEKSLRRDRLNGDGVVAWIRGLELLKMSGIGFLGTNMAAMARSAMSSPVMVDRIGARSLWF